MIYDVIIVGAGAAGLFAGINLDKKLNKLILEKIDKPGTKVLLSGGERANVSNMDIEVERDYFGQNKKALISVFNRYNQWDIMNYFSSVGINIIEEDRGRLILESGDSKELLDVLLKGIKKNNCELKINNDVIKINNVGVPFMGTPNNNIKNIANNNIKNIANNNIENNNNKYQNIYEITTKENQKYKSKNVIISSGGKSFFQVGTTGEGYNFAKELGINIIPPYRSLCGLTTKKDLSNLSGNSMNLELIIKDKNKEIYREFGPLLFTHFGISGPIVFNTGNALGEYLNYIKIESEQEKIKYILDNIIIELKIDKEKATKKIYGFFKNEIDNDEKIEFGLQDWRSWKEAKATGGGIDINELDNNMQSKKYPGLFFIGEVVDITGKTGGFNLQWAWSSAFVCSKNIKK